MQLNFTTREVAIKLVYYGPALSVITTNLKALLARVAEESRGRLMTLDTKDDRTLFFVADSQVSETQNNAASFVDLRSNFKDMGRSLSQVPLVIQFNKRDLANIRRDAEIDDLARCGSDPVYKASATRSTELRRSAASLGVRQS